MYPLEKCTGAIPGRIHYLKWFYIPERSLLLW